MARKWFALSIAIKSLSSKTNDAIAELVGRKLSKQQLCTLRKVAKYPEELGALCDEIGVPIELHRFIAHAPNEAERDERARQSIAALLDKRAMSGHADGLAKAVCGEYFKPRKAA